MAEPVPDSLSVFEDFTDAVQGDVVSQAGGVHDVKRLRRIRRELNRSQGHPDDAFLDPVVVSQLELAAGELRIPADAMQ